MKFGVIESAGYKQAHQSMLSVTSSSLSQGFKLLSPEVSVYCSLLFVDSKVTSSSAVIDMSVSP